MGNALATEDERPPVDEAMGVEADASTDHDSGGAGKADEAACVRVLRPPLSSHWAVTPATVASGSITE
jgi:hypothetical protein